VNIVTTLIQILLLGAEAVLALMIAYLLLLTSAALFAPRHTKVREWNTAAPCRRGEGEGAGGVRIA